MPRRVPGLEAHWEQFLLCVLFHLLLPLLPIGIELWVSHRVTDTTLTLGAAMYAISIGSSSKSRLMFGFSVVLCIIYSIAFGVLTGGTAQSPGAGSLFGNAYATIALLLIFLVHAGERYNRHIVDRAPFWEF